MQRVIIIILLSIGLSGCGLEQRERAVKQKEADLTVKEQSLLLKEQSLLEREAQVALRERQMDSLWVDSSILVNPMLAGQWQVKMVCTETTCAGSAVGDTKNETWNISVQGMTVVAKAMTGEKLVRVYTGGIVSNALELVENVEMTATAPATRIVVRLTKIGDKTIEGIREIIQPNCKIVYTLQLTK